MSNCWQASGELENSRTPSSGVPPKAAAVGSNEGINRAARPVPRRR